MTRPHPIYALICLALFPFTFAQFGNFFQGGFPFGQGHSQEHFHHQQQHAAPSRGQKGWDEMQAVHCGAGYVCPASLACVPTPADCPCPYPQDVKCVIPDDRERDEGEGPPFVCVRDVSCDEVLRFAKPI